MQAPRSHAFSPRGAPTRRGAHRRAGSPTRWWVVAAATAILVTGTGLATAEISHSPETRPAADGNVASPAPSDSSAGIGPTGVTSPSSSPSETPSSSPSETESDEPSSHEETSDEPADEFASLRAEVVDLVNEGRTSAGCGTVKANGKLRAAATGHSRDMAANGYFDHTSRDGRTFSDRAAEQGYHHAIGENIAAGQTSAEAVMDAWMNSDGHRANILNCDARAIGMGVAKSSDGTRYWTQVFGSR